MATRKLHHIPILAIVLAVALLGVLGPMVNAQQAVVRMYLFFSSECPDCKEIREQFLPPLISKYGNKLEIKSFDILDPKSFELMTKVEQAYGIGADRSRIPEAYLGQVALIGKEEIQAKLEQTILTLLAAGGSDYPLTQAPTNTPAAQLSASSTPTTIPTVTPPAQETVPGAVHAMLFFSPTCPHCHLVRSEVMPKLYEKYGQKLVVREFDVSDDYNFALEIAIEQTAGMPGDRQGYVPLMVIGRYLLTNANSIQQGVQSIIDEYLAQGGVGWPIDPKFFTPSAEAGTAGTPQVNVELTKAPSSAGTPAASAAGKTVKMAYFAKAGCQECDRAQYEINYLKSKYNYLDVTVFDIQQNAALNEWLCTKYGVAEQYRLTAPSIFVGQDYLVGKDVSTANIEKLIQKYSAQGAPSTWDNWQSEAPQASSNIIERFKSFGLLTIVPAALVDGINPCAFATIVFFVSYLAFAGRKKREILLVGGAFALGVFLTYFAVGLGLYQVLTRLPFLASLKIWVYGITAALCLVLAIFSVLDFIAARRGSPEEMRLRIPINLRRRINTMIRETASAQALVGMALVTAVVVSIIELACTGQVYLPTIMYVIGVPQLRAQAVLYLLLYNVLFILPLLVVFGLVYFGTSSEKLQAFVGAKTATVKLITAALFIFLAGLMVTIALGAL